MFKLFHNDTVVSPSYIDHTLKKISNFLKVVKCHILQVYNVCGIERKFKDFLFVRTQLDLSQTCLRSVSWIWFLIGWRRHSKVWKKTKSCSTVFKFFGGIKVSSKTHLLICKKKSLQHNKRGQIVEPLWLKFKV